MRSSARSRHVHGRDASAAAALLVAYDNIVDYGSNWAFVQHVLAMDTVFPDNALKSARDHRSGAFRSIAYWVIIATEGVIGLVCLRRRLAAVSSEARRVARSSPRSGSP